MKRLFLILCIAVLLCSNMYIVSATHDGPMDDFEDELPRGDINGNGELDTLDYMILKRSILGTYTLSADEASRADVNLDGEVSSMDYMMLKRVILGTYSF